VVDRTIVVRLPAALPAAPYRNVNDQRPLDAFGKTLGTIESNCITVRRCWQIFFEFSLMPHWNHPARRIGGVIRRNIVLHCTNHPLIKGAFRPGKVGEIYRFRPRNAGRRAKFLQLIYCIEEIQAWRLLVDNLKRQADIAGVSTKNAAGLGTMRHFANNLSTTGLNRRRGPSP
jgi:hypothetical protein